MTSGKRGSYISIELAVRQIISGKDAITVDVLHADNKFHIFLKKMSKDIEAFISAICHQNNGYRIGVTVNHGIQRSPFMKFLFSLNQKITIRMVHDIVKSINVNGIITLFTFMDKSSFIIRISCYVDIRTITC